MVSPICLPMILVCMHATTSLVNNLPAFENVILYGDNVNPNHLNKLPDSTGMKIIGTNTNVTSTSSLCTDSLNSTDRESFPEHHTAAVNTFSKEYSKGPGAADRDLHPKQHSDTSASSQQCSQDQSHTPTQPDFTVLADNDDQSYATYSSTRGEHIVNSKYQKCDSTNTGYIKGATKKQTKLSKNKQLKQASSTSSTSYSNRKKLLSNEENQNGEQPAMSDRLTNMEALIKEHQILQELEEKRLKAWERKLTLKEKEINKRIADIEDKSKQVAHIQSYVVG